MRLTILPNTGKVLSVSFRKSKHARIMKQNKEDKSCSDGKLRSVESYIVTTPIGNMLLKACSNGLHMINQVNEICDENFNPLPEQIIALSGKSPKDKGVDNVVKSSITWLNTYFFEPQKIASVPLPSFCTISEEGKFHDHVQLTLAKHVAFGKIVSYKGLAALTRSPGAFQSVGSAMRNNPFQLMVPCHRVINSGSKLGVYSGGRRNKTKEWLLKHEGLEVRDGIVL